MATDFMIMPISRYVSGDFVTPDMKLAWREGVPFVSYGRGGRREYPPGQPFGGPDASARRDRFLPTLQRELTKLPAAVGHQLWDEASEAESRFHRVDSASYQALIEEAKTKGKRLSFLTTLGLSASSPLHVTATLFLPSEFSNVFAMAGSLTRNAGSAKRALKELSSKTWAAEAELACETLTDALTDAIELKLPMIVDS